MLERAPLWGPMSGVADPHRGLASMYMRCNSVAEMRNLAPLPKDAQELIDRAVVRVGLERLAITADFLAEGLTFPVANPMSVMEVYWESISRTGHAIRTMKPEARGERQLPDRSPNRIPIYVTIDDFSFNSRVLLASQRAGAPIDTTLVSDATRNVNESIEDAMINGVPFNVAGNDAPGLLNAPGVNTFTLTGPWDTLTGEQILQDILGMAGTLRAVRRFGPYNLYIPADYGNVLNEDFKTNSDKTVRTRLEELRYGGRGIRVREADMLPPDTVVMVQMTEDIADIITGQMPTVVSWEDGPGWQRFFAVLAFMVPRIKVDYDGGTGIVVGTPAP